MKNIVNFFQEKKNKSPISVVTCYDYTFAKLVAATDIDCILVGDSLGMVIQGHNSTLPVTLDEMIYHTKAVRRGAPEKFIIADMPFLSYQTSLEEGIRSAGKIMKESGADAVKLEGGNDDCFELVHRLVECGIPVMGHLGLTPQSYQTLGGYKVQAKDDASAEILLEDSMSLEEAGAFSIVLEMIPESVGKKVSEKIFIPTIGIGAGRYTDGQVLVINDLLGMNSEFTPKFLKKYADLSTTTKSAIQTYHEEVVGKKFPEEKNCF
ncbi:3-methyl-2-oxobutanoate hydroxymethyltransferase [Leptospira sp. GIMC2001]|uniref:3-methyl-2-oxobutanoate hydroxymethyltransferase n=1 Tax=Leptospira sp. GIMC2001 TaxID=1513297 RepID=UPI00234AB476|nr:3-methyl-2-oxobutanoate hydroxymethyltransferase [Leptospira sp. GIMC2001]WCL49220.1 3-methyl-2-oxobutanoate hydroxymethyltransferase [Leptospira sp. GIMC2001]